MNSIIVGLPCYNEEGNILKVIEDIKSESLIIEKNYGYDLKILVVDDGSTDNTISLLKDLEGVILVEHIENKGLGVAVNTIFSEVLKLGKEGDMLVIMDSDFTHKAKYIKDLVEKYKKESSLNVVICSRYREGSEVRGLSKFREFISLGASFYNQIFLNIKGVKDYTCGYRMYTYRTLKSLDTSRKNRGRERIVESDGFSCMVEVAYKIDRIGGNFGEVPFILEYGDREGQSKMKILKTTFSSLLLPFKLRING